MEDLIVTGRLITLIGSIGLSLMGLAVLAGITLSMVRKRIHRTLGQIWIPVFITLGVIFFVMVIVMLYGVRQQYDIFRNLQ